MFALAGLSVVLILIILLQRGRGGGLAGAFGGAGGQSALGTRAGDVFTKITIGLAVAWILLACVDNFILQAQTERFVEAPGADETVIAPAEGTETDLVAPAATTPVDVDAELDDEDAFLAEPALGADDPAADE